ncbi:MBOAT family protein [Acaryochloris sp. IP29b_bin.148]|uniref:MBOAT family O-acyltransferase n=1 Tax=Acaryochloris sp. IP29b_bin.148 TaxID=2969218 RepID=UPI002622F5B8|nr:MBOAT family protein [Acaryochloris sp. IP29b_bin.148]
MLFNSYSFIFIFLPTSLIIFTALRNHKNTNISIFWLVLASLFFYCWWKPVYLPILLFSIGFNYIAGYQLSRNKSDVFLKKCQLAGSIAINLLLLGYFKYLNFFFATINNLVGTDIQFQAIALPLAISFFTFQQIAYLVDSYRGKTQEYNFLQYCLFVSYFPQLIAGPIVHHDDVIPQFSHEKSIKIRNEDIAIGLTIFSIGLFKKVVFADTAATFANPIFESALSGGQVDLLQSWLGALAYTLQLYFDFSGYSDMAIGAARLFGIHLPLNFNSPYKSISITDFWRRWHITLSQFLRDYLYIPLGGNRKSEIRRYINLILTMLLGGLWHGAGWTFVLWGGLHGAYLVVHRLWEKTIPPISSWWYQISAQLLTFLAVVVSWVLFRSTDLASASVVLQGMVGVNGIHTTPSIHSIAWFSALLAIVFFAPNSQELIPSVCSTFKDMPTILHNDTQYWQWRPNTYWAIFVATILVVAVAFISKENEFIYFQF